jgi:hypothetical protein|tara:strand:- start:463 stop:882 length:420 start_codon:yes stop_codon:yes gene_type:complete
VSYKCVHFKIYELVPPGVYRIRGEKAWELLDDRALITLDMLRDNHGKITVNDWFWGGNYKYSGYRPKDCKEGSKLSQHRMGRAFDLKFIQSHITIVRNDILNNPRKYPEITAVELNTPTWLHFDVRNYDTSQGILTFKP